MTRQQRADRRSQDSPPPELPIDEAYERYPGEWVLLRVTRLDEHHGISHGQILGHFKTEKAITRLVARAHQDDPDQHLYVFFGGWRPRTLEEWQAALEEAARRGPISVGVTFGW